MKMRTAKARAAFCCVAFLATCCIRAEYVLRTLPLNGTWKFRLDAEDVGVTEKWFTQQFDDTVQLPGTTDENHKGVKKDEQCIDQLSRVWYWKGPAWYQRRVTVGNITGKAASGQITVRCKSYNVDKSSTFKNQSVKVKAPERENVVEFTYEPGEDPAAGSCKKPVIGHGSRLAVRWNF